MTSAEPVAVPFPVSAPPLPADLQVEVTGACNLRCRMCLVRYAPAVGRGEGALSYEQFTDLVDGLPGLTRLTLQGLGEPLLAPHLVDMVRYASVRGVAVGFNSNAVLLTSRRSAELIHAGLSWLHVSLDGATAATYEEIRHNTRFAPQAGQFDTVVRNLRSLVALRGGDSPAVKLVFVAMRRNIAELPALVRLASDIGVDELRVQNLSHTFSDTDPGGDYAGIRDYSAEEALDGHPELASAAFADASAEAARAGLALRLPEMTSPPAGDRRAGRPGCTWPWDGAYVTHRGEVQPCCMVMGSDRVMLGRLGDAPFGEIWHSEAYQDFRARLLTDDPPEVCEGCAMYRGVF
jgi:radical SAM protein with 4Fe4S-binding SPASM domain